MLNHYNNELSYYQNNVIHYQEDLTHCIPNYKIYKLQHVNIYYMARFISQTMVYYPIITSKWGYY